MRNETLLALEKRASCSEYDEKPVEQEKLEAIALAATQSPSAMNLQPWKVIVVTNRALIEELTTQTVSEMSRIKEYEKMYQVVKSTGMDLSRKAPCMIILAIDKKDPYSPLDCGIASQSICIAAQSLGVASHIVAIQSVAFDGEKGSYFKEKFQFPEGYEFGLGILLGYAKTEDTPHEPDLNKITYIK